MKHTTKPRMLHAVPEGFRAGRRASNRDDALEDEIDADALDADGEPLHAENRRFRYLET